MSEGVSTSETLPMQVCSIEDVDYQTLETSQFDPEPLTACVKTRLCSRPAKLGTHFDCLSFLQIRRSKDIDGVLWLRIMITCYSSCSNHIGPQTPLTRQCCKVLCYDLQQRSFIKGGHFNLPDHSANESTFAIFMLEWVSRHSQLGSGDVH